MNVRTLFYTLASSALLPSVSRAANFFDPNGEFSDIGLSSDSPMQITLNIIEVFLSVLAVLVLVLIVYAGFLILTSAGNEEKVQKGMMTIRWAIIGTILIMSSLGIVLYLDNVLF